MTQICSFQLCRCREAAKVTDLGYSDAARDTGYIDVFYIDSSVARLSLGQTNGDVPDWAHQSGDFAAAGRSRFSVAGATWGSTELVAPPQPDRQVPVLIRAGSDGSSFPRSDLPMPHARCSADGSAAGLACAVSPEWSCYGRFLQRMGTRPATVRAPTTASRFYITSPGCRCILSRVRGLDLRHGALRVPACPGRAACASRQRRRCPTGRQTAQPRRKQRPAASVHIGDEPGARP